MGDASPGILCMEPSPGTISAESLSVRMGREVEMSMGMEIRAGNGDRDKVGGKDGTVDRHEIRDRDEVGDREDRDSQEIWSGEMLLFQPPQSPTHQQGWHWQLGGFGAQGKWGPTAFAPPGSSMHRDWPTPTCSSWWLTSPSAASASLSSCCRQR